MLDKVAHMSLENRTRICPRCGEKVIAQSPRANRKAIELQSICKLCRSNRIPQILTQVQNEFLVGLMLGDGGLVQGKTNSFPRLSVSRQTQDKDYLFWQYELFKEFYGTPPKSFHSWHSGANKYYDGYSCMTKSGKLFGEWRHKWYPNGEKIVPRDIALTPLTLLVWFLDDGCI